VDGAGVVHGWRIGLAMAGGAAGALALGFILGLADEKPTRLLGQEHCAEDNASSA